MNFQKVVATDKGKSHWFATISLFDYLRVYKDKQMGPVIQLPLLVRLKLLYEVAKFNITIVVVKNTCTYVGEYQKEKS